MNTSRTPQFRHSFALLFFAAIASAATVSAQQPMPTPSAKSLSRPNPLGVHGFAAGGVNWAPAHKSFNALGLDSKPKEFGGGAVVSNIWRHLFAQVSITRSSDTGERTFVDGNGDGFPLGIPLHVETTCVDVSAGWKFDLRRGQSGRGLLPYVGGGAGVTMYSEDSPFAEPGDDVSERARSYHVLGGIEFRATRWLGFAGDLRYRMIPDLLGTAGVSEVQNEDSYGGPVIAARVLVGF